MRILVAIANHGTKNAHFLQALLDEYRRMPFDVDIVVLSDTDKDLGDDVEVHVGAPGPSPWSLPFAHRPIFAQRASEYDLFIYSEDDTLLTAAQIESFVEAQAVLPADRIAGFLRYERFPSGERSFCSVHSGYHWEPGSVEHHGGMTFARFSNDHAACYILTAGQLHRAIESGGFLVEAHEGPYDMLVTAATDPYTQCGFTKVIPVSRVDDFLLHHLPNVYLGKLGISEGHWKLQLDVLLEGDGEENRLFPTESALPTERWDRSYYPEPTDALRDAVSSDARSVLSVGCGSGALERGLYGWDTEVVGIPLDRVIAAVAQSQAIETLPSRWDVAFGALEGRAFDEILLADVVQHVADPVDLLRALAQHLAPQGRIVLSAPNFSYHRAVALVTRNGRPVPSKGTFTESRLHATDAGTLERWLRSADLRVSDVHHHHGQRVRRHVGRLPSRLRGSVADAIVVSASRRQ